MSTHSSHQDTPPASVEEAVPKNLPENQEELIYDRGSCWLVCISSFLSNGCSWGMNTAFSIYFSYYINNNTFPGASKIDYSAIGGFAFGATLIFTPFINYLQGLIGVRNSIILGNCLQFTSLMLASFSKKLWQLYLTQGLLQSSGLALISLPNLTILSQFFRKKRVLASGISTAGSGIFGIIFNLGMQGIVEARDPFWALRAQAIISFVMVWIAIALFRSRDKHHNVEFTLYDTEVLRLHGYWFVAFYCMFCLFGYVTTLYTIVNYTTSLGYTAYQGSIAAAMIQLGSFIGRPIVGLVADKYGVTNITFYCYLVSGILCLAMWIPARNFATVLIFGLIIGGIMGVIFSTVGPILAKLVGISKMNVSVSMLWILVAASGLTSPIIGVAASKGDEGGVVDPTKYLYCILFAGLSFLVSALNLFLLRGYILARDEILNSNLEEKDTTIMENDASALLSIRVPISMTLKYSLHFTAKV